MHGAADTGTVPYPYLYRRPNPHAYAHMYALPHGYPCAHRDARTHAHAPAHTYTFAQPEAGRQPGPDAYP